MLARRRYLRSGGSLILVGLTGCAFGGCGRAATVRLIRATDETLTNRFADQANDGRLGPSGAPIVQAAISEGVATYEAGERLFADGRYTYEGKFYAISQSVTETKIGLGYDAEFEYSSDVTPDAETDDVVAFDQLPRGDRHAVMNAFLNAWARRIKLSQGRVSGAMSGGNMLIYPNETARQTSVLVPESAYSYIEYEGHPIRFSVQNNEREVEYHTFEVHAQEVAASPGKFARFVKDQVLAPPVNLDERELTERQREILNSALSSDHGYDTCIDGDGSSKTEFRDLIRLIFDIDGEISRFHSEKPRLVVYQGKEYLAYFSVAVE